MINGMNSISKTLIILGGVLIVSGLIWHFTDGKIPFGRLPGDFRYESENTKIYIPITTSIVLSVVVTLLSVLFRK
jgi:hypothetical protein